MYAAWTAAATRVCDGAFDGAGRHATDGGLLISSVAGIALPFCS
jgi:hypothetical protein